MVCRGYVWHITHRCHKKQFLLRFKKDRWRWRHWLFEARRRFELCVLNYIVTSNHVHLLVRDMGDGEIPRAMQLIAGRTAQEYNLRKSRCGAFWEDRYHATAVATDTHLLNCMTYIDLNMVRAGAVSHPSEWDVSGYREIQVPWQRKGIINFAMLRRLTNSPSNERLATTLATAASQQLTTSKRDPAWTEAVGVGDLSFISRLQASIGPTATHRKIIGDGFSKVLRESHASYSAKTSPESAV